MAISSYSKSLIGMLHVPALPGTPTNHSAPDQIIDHALYEAHVLTGHGYHGLILENMHDAPYTKGRVGPEVVATMAAAALAVRREHPGIQIGIQILAAANREAMAVAHAAGLELIRAEGFVFGHVADEGYIDSCAGDLLRYRKQISADAVQVFCDIKKKHSSHALTSDISLAETARAAEFFRADGLIVTGTATGQPTDLDDLRAVREASDLPLVVGSGTTPENVASYLEIADAAIVGSWIKYDGDWRKPVDPDRVARLAEASGIVS